MKKVSFGMYWENYGRAEIALPETVNAENRSEVLAYIKEAWNEVGLPIGEYVQDSDCLDEESVIMVTNEDGTSFEPAASDNHRQTGQEKKLPDAERLAYILQEYVANDLEAAEPDYVRDVLESCCGMTKEEMEALGFSEWFGLGEEE